MGIRLYIYIYIYEREKKFCDSTESQHLRPGVATFATRINHRKIDYYAQINVRKRPGGDVSAVHREKNETMRKKEKKQCEKKKKKQFPLWFELAHIVARNFFPHELRMFTRAAPRVGPGGPDPPPFQNCNLRGTLRFFFDFCQKQKKIHFFA